MLSFIPASVHAFFEAHPQKSKCSRKEDPTLPSVIKTHTNRLYTLQQLLGEKGAEGKVKQGFTEKGAPVAIKVVTLERRYAYVSQEVAVLAKLGRLHEIVTRQINSETRRLYIIETFVPGTSLRQKLNTYTTEQKLIVAINLALALLKLHTEHRVVHGDVKPENVMVNNDLEVTLVDFGFAQILPEGAEIVQGIVMSQTPGYGAPEVVNQKHYSAASDIFALGRTFKNDFYFTSKSYADMTAEAPTKRLNYLQVLQILVGELKAQPKLSDKARTKIQESEELIKETPLPKSFTKLFESLSLKRSTQSVSPAAIQAPWAYPVVPRLSNQRL